MKSIISLLEPENLKTLASRSNYRYGQEIARDDEIKITKSNTFNILAEIKPFGKQTTITELHSTTKGLRWKCSCTNKKSYFCEHCVAIGILLSVKEL
jgi:hypothetical protein